MSKKQAIANGLQHASKQSKEKCGGCRWYLSQDSEEGRCAKWNVIVNNSQVCDIWGQGYEGKYNEKLIREYKQRRGHSKEYIKHPQSHSPWPTEEDFDSHFITRYFVKYGSKLKNPITEVSEDNYKIIDEEFYHKIELEWKINGPPHTIRDDDDNILDKGISAANRDTLLLYEKEMVGIKNYLTDLTELAFVKVGTKEVGDVSSSQKPKKKSVYGGSGRRESLAPKK